MDEELKNIRCIDALPFTVKPFLDITNTLPQKSNPEQPRTKDQIKRISVHHSAVEGASIQSYANYHVNTLGWPCIGYHFVIKGDQAYQTNSLGTFSYHTSGQNYDTVSVSVSGDLSKRPLSDDERNNLYAVILTYMKLFSIPIENVLGHREFPEQNTACPSIDMSKVREDIAKLQLQMKASDDPTKVKEKCYQGTSQHNWLYGQYQKDPIANKWLEPHLSALYDFMKERGLFFGSE